MSQLDDLLGGLLGARENELDDLFEQLAGMASR
jgi:hypothetical protein